MQAPSADGTLWANQTNETPAEGRHSYPDMGLNGFEAWEYGNGPYAWVDVNQEDVCSHQGQTSITEATPQCVIPQPYVNELASNGTILTSDNSGSFPNVDIDDVFLNGTTNPDSFNVGVYGSFNFPPMNHTFADQMVIHNPVANLGLQIPPANALGQRERIISRKTRHRCQWSTCTKTFGRSSDLERHINTVHLKTRACHCPVYGCPKSLRLGRPYSRLDKLQEHMRLKHANLENVFTH